MKTVVVDVMQKRLEKELNAALKKYSLDITKIDFCMDERQCIIININSISLFSKPTVMNVAVSGQ